MMCTLLASAPGYNPGNKGRRRSSVSWYRSTVEAFNLFQQRQSTRKLSLALCGSCAHDYILEYINKYIVYKRGAITLEFRVILSTSNFISSTLLCNQKREHSGAPIVGEILKDIRPEEQSLRHYYASVP